MRIYKVGRDVGINHIDNDNTNNDDNNSDDNDNGDLFCKGGLLKPTSLVVW